MDLLPLTLEEALGIVGRMPTNVIDHRAVYKIRETLANQKALLAEARRVVEPFATCIADDERENAILGEPVRSDEDWLDARVAHFRSAAAFLEKLGPNLSAGDPGGEG